MLLDESFLRELGLDTLPEDQKKAFLDHVYSQLELRVGARLSDGLTDAQLAEFESFLNKDQDKVHAWISTYAPAYATDPSYTQLKEKIEARGGDIDQLVLLAEYASLKWLNLNRPDYHQVVAEALDALKQEIMRDRNEILASA